MYIEDTTGQSNRIAVAIQPFALYQQVHVLQNGKEVYNLSVPLMKLEETIKKLSNEYNIEEVDLAGGVMFTNKIKNKLINSTQFSKQIKINTY